MKAREAFLLISIIALVGVGVRGGLGGVALFLIAWFLGGLFQAAAERERGKS